MSTNQPHSAELFVTPRDFWWNVDFMELMARRWRLEEVRSGLDVGSGLGHWGRTLVPHVGADVTIGGVDPEPRWVALASEMAAKVGMTSRLRYSRGSADQLPFANDTFDMVTCQTVLVHVADVHRAPREMIRVLKPGGLLTVAEPNNLVFSVLLGRTRFSEGVEITLALVRLQVTCERGKAALGEGNNSVGDLPDDCIPVTLLIPNMGCGTRPMAIGAASAVSALTDIFPAVISDDSGNRGGPQPGGRKKTE